MTKHDLPTPALLLDLDRFESNLRKMAAHLRERGLGFRPHAKTHKCLEVARAQIAAGACGICTAKLSEAEVFAAGGIRGLLITTAIIGRQKIERALRLAAAAPDTIFVVDDDNNAQELSDAAQAGKLDLNIAIDLYVGNRTGVAPGGPAVDLAQKLAKLPRLHFQGLQAYVGYASHTAPFAKRCEVSREAVSKAIETRRLLERAGFAVPIVSGGSTGTYNIDSEIQGITEMQPGSFIFMDVEYSRIGGRDGETYSDFSRALTVVATVVSRPEPHKAIVDAGIKSFSTDKGLLPECRSVGGVVYAFAGDEHGRLDLSQAERDVKLGDRLEFVVPHCDPTVNLYDQIHGLRGEKVEAVWKIAARGMSQ
ncbi:MAG TPA: DSD1 family PLP-dependent enzyme [Bryobacterales bacterium]|nr:DSD1 family PLP-dependent enzyme [Bryobacterales bacterium]